MRLLNVRAGVPRLIFMKNSPEMNWTGLSKFVDASFRSMRPLRSLERFTAAANRLERVVVFPGLRGESGWSLCINVTRSTWEAKQTHKTKHSYHEHASRVHINGHSSNLWSRARPTKRNIIQALSAAPFSQFSMTLFHPRLPSWIYFDKHTQDVIWAPYMVYSDPTPTRSFDWIMLCSHFCAFLDQSMQQEPFMYEWLAICHPPILCWL